MDNKRRFVNAFFAESLLLLLGFAICVVAVRTKWPIPYILALIFPYAYYRVYRIGSVKSRFPDESLIEEGAKYGCEVDFDDGTGTVVDKDTRICWRYSWEPATVRNRLRNPFLKRDFVFRSDNGSEVVRIRRRSFIPPVFEIMIDDVPVGRIRLTTPLRIRYNIELAEGNAHTFRLPVFTVYFSGYMNRQTTIWVVLGPSKRHWIILFRPGVFEPRLLAALSFIHTEWWRYC